jgi:hypothetical protein
MAACHSQRRAFAIRDQLDELLTCFGMKLIAPVCPRSPRDRRGGRKEKPA